MACESGHDKSKGLWATDAVGRVVIHCDGIIGSSEEVKWSNEV